MNRSFTSLILFSGILLGSFSCFAETKQIIKGSQPLPELPEDAYTLVVIPDTQSYFGKGSKKTPNSQEPITNAFLAAQVDWILANLKSQNIVFVTHVGDIVDSNVPEQWEVAKQHLQKLHGTVPFSLTVGNHDMTSKGDARLFQKYFPALDFASYPWYLGSFERSGFEGSPHVSINNVNGAQLFSAGGIDFIHLSLECNAPDDVLSWADQLLRKHSNRHAIITTHMDLGVIEKPTDPQGYVDNPKGRMRWNKIHGELGNTPEQMWEKLYRHHSNLRLILCGDQSRATSMRLTRESDHGQPITSLLSDYQSQPVIRLMRFIPSKDEIEVLTYDVQQNVMVDETRFVKELDQHQFKLAYPMKSAAAK